MDPHACSTLRAVKYVSDCSGSLSLYQDLLRKAIITWTTVEHIGILLIAIMITLDPTVALASLHYTIHSEKTTIFLINLT